MRTNHLKCWPKKIPTTLTVPDTPLHDNLVVSARRYPNKTAIDYYGNALTYHQLWTQAESFAGYLQYQLNLQKDDRVLLYMQNAPQFVVAFHGILRAGGVVVPLNPMHLTDELRFYIEDSAASVAVVGQELYGRIVPLLGASGLRHIVVATYSDYLGDNTDASLPDFVRATRQSFDDPNTVLWADALATSFTSGGSVPSSLPSSLPGSLPSDLPSSLASNPAGLTAAPVDTKVEELAVMPYTSGTTGVPKGCMHPHRTIQANTVGACTWFGTTADGVILAALPFFHVTGDGPRHVGAHLHGCANGYHDPLESRHSWETHRTHTRYPLDQHRHDGSRFSSQPEPGGVQSVFPDGGRWWWSGSA